MALSLARSGKVAGVAARSSAPRVSSVRPAVRSSLRTSGPRVASGARISTKALPMEVAQVASEAAFITGTALTMCAITLVGLAVGFVLLRAEALVQEGKL